MSIVFGPFWGVAAIPYHAVPLLTGATTWQNFSGLARIVAGVAMVALGIKIALGRRDETPPEQAPWQARVGGVAHPRSERLVQV